MSIQSIERISADMIDPGRVLEFSLVQLKQGPVLPLAPTEDQACPVLIANDGQWPYEILDDVRRTLGENVQILIADKDAILLELHRVFDLSSTSAEQAVEDLHEQGDLVRGVEEVRDLLESDDEAPVIRLVNTLIGQALKERASDIHIEPFEQEVCVRFRIDGILFTIVKPPKGVQSALVSRIKVLADLDIAEKRHPQDGRFRVRIAGREVDIRVSVLPTAFGERVVMRLLDRGAKFLCLSELGMNKAQLDLTIDVVSEPHGIVLVTGPTGSGKTTTLYSALMEVNRTDRNVLTIEDPIEYQLDNVGQMQVNSKIGLNFSTGLRSILRQDPDIVMIGEIRDLETAEIAIQASLTGHLVLSTLHTNDALSSIVRLMDMGVEPYLVASSLLLLQAQRLARTLCPECKEEHPVGDFERTFLGDDYDFNAIYQAKGCPKCMNTGYIGRIGVYEMIRIDSIIRTAIHEGTPLPRLREMTRNMGMKSLREDGVRHVLSGLTSIDEVLRITQQDDVVVS